MLTFPTQKVTTLLEKVDEILRKCPHHGAICGGEGGEGGEGGGGEGGDGGEGSGSRKRKGSEGGEDRGKRVRKDDEEDGEGGARKSTLPVMGPSSPVKLE